MNYLITFIISFLILIGLDFTFLGFLMSEYYKRLLAPAITLEFSLIPAFMFYLFYLLGIFYFVVMPNLSENNLWRVLTAGAIFGFICYMTYDLTNMATIKNWSWKVVLLDISWGTFVTSIISIIAYKLLNYF